MCEIMYAYQERIRDLEAQNEDLRRRAVTATKNARYWYDRNIEKTREIERLTAERSKEEFWRTRCRALEREAVSANNWRDEATRLGEALKRSEETEAHLCREIGRRDVKIKEMEQDNIRLDIDRANWRENARSLARLAKMYGEPPLPSRAAEIKRLRGELSALISTLAGEPETDSKYAPFGKQVVRNGRIVFNAQTEEAAAAFAAELNAAVERSK